MSLFDSLGGLLGNNSNTNTQQNQVGNSSGTQSGAGTSESNLWRQLSGYFGGYGNLSNPGAFNPYQIGGANNQVGVAGGLGSAFNTANNVGQYGFAPEMAAFQNPYNDQVIKNLQSDFARQNAEQMSGNHARQAAGASLGNKTGADALLMRSAYDSQNKQLDAARQAGFNTSAGLAAQNTGLQLQGANTAAGLTGAATGANQALFNQGQTLWSDPLSWMTQWSQGLSPWTQAAGQNYNNQGAYTGFQNTNSTGQSHTNSYNGGDLIAGGLNLAGSLAAFSDERVKKDIAPIGKTFDGQPIYRFSYLGSPQTQIGLLAQDVEHKHPHAVGEVGGVKTVDYDAATAPAAHKGHFAFGGRLGAGSSFADKVMHAHHVLKRLHGGRVGYEEGGDVLGGGSDDGGLASTSNPIGDFASGFGKWNDERKKNQNQQQQPAEKSPFQPLDGQSMINAGLGRLASVMQPPRQGFEGGGEVDPTGMPQSTPFERAMEQLQQGESTLGAPQSPEWNRAGPGESGPSYLGGTPPPAAPSSGWDWLNPFKRSAPSPESAAPYPEPGAPNAPSWSKWDQLVNSVSSGLGTGKLHSAKLADLQAQREASLLHANLSGQYQGAQSFPAAVKMATLTGKLPGGVKTMEGELHDPALILSQVKSREALEQERLNKLYRQKWGAGATDEPAPMGKAGAIPQASYTPSAGAGAPGARPQAADPTAEASKAVRGSVLPFAQDPQTATGNWQTLMKDPVHGHAIESYFQSSGEKPANAIEAARMFVAGTSGGPRPAGAIGATAPPQAQIQGAPAAQPELTLENVRPPQRAPQQQTTDPDQLRAQALLDRDKERLRDMIATNQPGVDALDKRIMEAEKMKMYPIPGKGFVALPGAAETEARGAAIKTTEEESAKASAAYHSDVAKGGKGAATIAANQQQNLQLLKLLMEDPNFGSGTLVNWQTTARRALATAGYNPDASRPNEVFDMIMGRVLADQFAGLKSMSSQAGETAGRIFAPMLAIEEKALPHATDSLEGKKMKVAILDNAGKLMMKWGNAINDYEAKYGRLDPNFDKALRNEVAKARVWGQSLGVTPEDEQRAHAEIQNMRQGGVGAPSGAAVSPAKSLAGLPDGIHDFTGSGGQRFMKHGADVTPLSGPLGSATNPLAHKADVTEYGQHVYENGKLYRRTTNPFMDRWEEVKP